MEKLRVQSKNRPHASGADGNSTERNGIESIKRETTVFGKPIHIFLGKTNWGIDVLITGGDRAHIGAVSVVDDQRHLYTQVFEGHKDDFISEEWAKTLHERYRVPVVVSVGIHYDGIDPAGIKTIVRTMQEQLDDIMTN